MGTAKLFGLLLFSVMRSVSKIIFIVYFELLTFLFVKKEGPDSNYLCNLKQYIHLFLWLREHLLMLLFYLLSLILISLLSIFTESRLKYIYRSMDFYMKSRSFLQYPYWKVLYRIIFLPC